VDCSGVTLKSREGSPDMSFLCYESLQGNGDLRGGMDMWRSVEGSGCFYYCFYSIYFYSDRWFRKKSKIAKLRLYFPLLLTLSRAQGGSARSAARY